MATAARPLASRRRPASCLAIERANPGASRMIARDLEREISGETGGAAAVERLIDLESLELYLDAIL